MGLFNKNQKNVSTDAVYKMITDSGNGFYSWNGNLYQSDIVRACIKPKTKALGKLIAKHIRESETESGKKLEINPVVYIRMMLDEPNEFMSFQVMIEKAANQLALNNNAFILILRNQFGNPVGLYPITCSGVEAKYDSNTLYLKFYLMNGKIMTIPYSDIIHIRDDFTNNDLFGESPIHALKEIMNTISVADQGIVKAIKNGSVIRWLLKFTNAMRPEDLKTNAEQFAENFLSMSSSTNGVAATDAKAEAQQITPHDYVPNEAQNAGQIKRVYNFFNTNEKIVNSTYTEDEWIAYYESVIEPIAQQMANEFTRKLFTRKERAFGNRIIFESSNLTYASMSTKLNLVQFVDRGVMTPNEVRYYLQMAPINGGDKALLRKDTGTLADGGENK